MTAPDRIYVYVAGSPVLPVLRQEWLLEPSEIAVTVEYIRADLARTPLAEAHPLAAEARTALARDDVAGWIGSLPKAPLAEAMAVPEVKAAELYVVWSHEHGCWWRPDSAGYTNDVRAAGVYTRAEAMSISHRGRNGWRAGTKPDELPVRVTDLPDWAQAALRAIGEARE